MKKFNYIYLITNTLNKKIYIGKHSTNDLDDGYMGSGVLVKKAIKKYGIENFTKEYLAFCDNKERLNYLEIYYIKKCKAMDKGYNLTIGGDGGRTSGTWIKGYKDSYETRKKKSDSHKGVKIGPMSNEHKQKISKTKKGKSQPKISKALKGRVSTFKWKHHTNEAKEKMRKARLGKSPTNKGIQQPKIKWITPTGEIKIMDENNVKRWHPDWKEIGEV